MGAEEKLLGKRLQEARQRAGLTQQELCGKAKLSISTLAKIERGAIKAPSIFTVSAIAQSVGVPVEELIGLDGNKSHGTKKKSKSGVSFIYFDVNGVLVRFFHRAFIKIAEETGASPDTIESTFWHFNDEVCRGDISLDEFNKIFAKQLGVSQINWQDYYLSSVDPITETHNVMVWASKHYRVGLLSNIMPGFIEKLINMGKLPDVKYDAIADSSKVGAIKPEPKIYQAAQEMAGVPAQEILFIDDGRTNIMAAEHAGWRVIWFDDYHPEESANRIRASLEF